MKYYAVKHKTIPNYYLTGGVSSNGSSPRMYKTQGKAESFRNKQSKPDYFMVVEWTISERVIPYQLELL